MSIDPWYFQPTEDRVRALTALAVDALDEWGGVVAPPELFLEGENAVFRADLSAHGTCAVRVHRAGYHSAEHLDWQVRWCRALTDEGIVRTPRIFDTAEGHSYVVRSHPEIPEPRYVSVLSWEPGGSLKDIDAPGTQTFTTLGTLIGRLQLHGRTWTHRDDFVGIRWDLDAFLGDDPILGPFWDTPLLDDDDRRIMTTFRRTAIDALDRFGTGPERFGIVHGDMLPQNLLVHDGSITVLDFDDCGHGWYLMEIAAALLGVAHGPDFDASRDALLEGYRTSCELDPADLEMLPLLIALRIATYVGWVMTHPFTPAAQHRGEAITKRGVRAVAQYLDDAGIPV
jgi:Ser/Thr protein kinase RdoA (MazF antagonist)